MIDVCYFCHSMSAHDRHYGVVMCSSCYNKVKEIKKQQGWT